MTKNLLTEIDYLEEILSEDEKDRNKVKIHRNAKRGYKERNKKRESRFKEKDIEPPIFKTKGNRR
jgi:hypothetical protein